MFAYCGNNPVSREDSSGEFWHLIVGAAVGVATQYIADVAINLMSGKSFAESLMPTSSWVDYGAAAISGALAASGIGLAGSIIANAALGGTTYLVNCAISGEEVNAIDFGLSVATGAVSGMVGGSGADGANLRGIAKTSKAMLKSLVSPRKIAMYTNKLANCATTVVVSTVRTFAAGITANLMVVGRKQLTQSTV